jgi:hypothetical protein
MGKASRSKRRRAAVRYAKRSRQNSWWYALTAIVVIVGIALVVYAKATTPTPVGPYVANQNNPLDPHNRDSHWHAALGVWNCDHWVGSDPSNGLWQWPAATPTGSPARAGDTNIYAGLHSHADGIIHMEPLVDAEAGRGATIGKYFEYGGWNVSSTGYNFVGTKAQNGDKCGSGTGTMQWMTARFNGNVNKAQAFTVQPLGTDPAKFKLHNDDIIVIGMMPPGKSIQSLGNPPSLKNLPDAKNNETAPGQNPTATTMPTIVTTPRTAVGAKTTPTATTPTTSATATTKP